MGQIIETGMNVKTVSKTWEKLPDIGGAGIDKLAKSITNRGGKLKLDTATLAVASMVQYIRHGDTDRLNMVGKVIEQTYTKNAARCYFAWLLTFNASLKWVDDKKEIRKAQKGMATEPRARAIKVGDEYKTHSFDTYSFWDIVTANEEKLFNMDMQAKRLLTRAIQAYNANLTDGKQNAVKYNQLVVLCDMLIADNVDVSSIDMPEAPIPPAVVARIEKANAIDKVKAPARRREAKVA